MGRKKKITKQQKYIVMYLITYCTNETSVINYLKAQC